MQHLNIVHQQYMIMYLLPYQVQQEIYQVQLKQSSDFVEYDIPLLFNASVGSCDVVVGDNKPDELPVDEYCVAA